eukprot:SAG22_NODE_2323_length_2712_cov_2.597398_2_plen_741_part_00
MVDRIEDITAALLELKAWRGEGHRVTSNVSTQLGGLHTVIAAELFHRNRRKGTADHDELADFMPDGAPYKLGELISDAKKLRELQDVVALQEKHWSAEVEHLIESLQPAFSTAKAHAATKPKKPKRASVVRTEWLEALTAELGGLSNRELRTRARELGADPEQLDECADSDEPRLATEELVLGLTPEPEPELEPEPEPEPEPAPQKTPAKNGASIYDRSAAKQAKKASPDRTASQIVVAAGPTREQQMAVQLSDRDGLPPTFRGGGVEELMQEVAAVRLVARRSASDGADGHGREGWAELAARSSSRFADNRGTSEYEHELSVSQLEWATHQWETAALPPASRARQRRGLSLYQDMTNASTAAWLADGRLVVCSENPAMEDPGGDEDEVLLTADAPADIDIFNPELLVEDAELQPPGVWQRLPPMKAPRMYPALCAVRTKAPSFCRASTVFLAKTVPFRAVPLAGTAVGRVVPGGRRVRRHADDAGLGRAVRLPRAEPRVAGQELAGGQDRPGGGHRGGGGGGRHGAGQVGQRGQVRLFSFRLFAPGEGNVHGWPESIMPACHPTLDTGPTSLLLNAPARRSAAPRSAASLGRLAHPRDGFGISQLADGRVMVAGGTHYPFGVQLGGLRSCEVWVEKANAWVEFPAMLAGESACLSVCPVCLLSRSGLSVWSVCLSVCLSVLSCLSVCLPACLSVCLVLSVCLSACLPVCLSVCPGQATSPDHHHQLLPRASCVPRILTP